MIEDSLKVDGGRNSRRLSGNLNGYNAWRSRGTYRSL